MKDEQNTPSIPTPLNELLVKLTIISMISENFKINCRSLNFVHVDSWIGSLKRYISGENRTELIEFLNQLIYRTIKAINDYKDFRTIIVNHLYASKKGIINLEKTYRDDPNIVANLRVLISNINIQLENYEDLITEENQKQIDNYVT